MVELGDKGNPSPFTGHTRNSFQGTQGALTREPWLRSIRRRLRTHFSGLLRITASVNSPAAHGFPSICAATRA
jgi:hypothetical protein